MGKLHEQKGQTDDEQEVGVDAPKYAALKNDRQREFVRILSTPPFPTVGQAGAMAGYSEWHGYQLHAMPYIQEAITEQLSLRRAEHEQKTLALIESLYVRGRAGDVKSAELFLEALGVIGRAAQVTVNDNRSLTVAFPERLAGLFAERRERLREVGIVDARPNEPPTNGGGNGNGNGNGQHADE